MLARGSSSSLNKALTEIVLRTCTVKLGRTLKMLRTVQNRLWQFQAQRIRGRFRIYSFGPVRTD